MSVEHEETITSCFCPLIFFLPCAYTYDLTITDETLAFNFGPVMKGAARVKINLSDIASCETGSSTATENLCQWGGWGVRLRVGSDGKRQWCYNPINGPWVQVTTNSGKSYRFSTRSPEKVAGLLGQKKQEGL